MNMRYKSVLAAAAAALAMCLGVGTASASRSLAVAGGGRVIREIDNSVELKLGGIEIICESTMVKTIHSAIAKIAGALYGFVTDVRFANCRGSLGLPATARALIETPWHIRYQSFTGTLPRITFVLVRIVEAKILITYERMLLCLYKGDIPIFKTGTAGAAELTVSSLISLEHQVPFFRALEGSGRCPSELEFGAFYLVEVPYTLRLI